MWDDDGENVLEHLAGVEDFDLAMATYRAACLRWPGAAITIRQGARILEDSRKRRLAAHHAVAEALHLELANVASPFAVVLLLAYHLVTPLLRRRSVLDF
jgi:hypothetical protein